MAVAEQVCGLGFTDPGEAQGDFDRARKNVEAWFAHVPGLKVVQPSEVTEFVAEIGLIFLLFMIGLEIDLKKIG